jgi:hypothetical protein
MGRGRRRRAYHGEEDAAAPKDGGPLAVLPHHLLFDGLRLHPVRRRGVVELLRAHAQLFNVSVALEHQIWLKEESKPLG